MSDSACDLDPSRRFIDALAGPDASVTWQTFDDNKERKDDRLAVELQGTLDQCAARLQRLNAHGAGVYVAVNDMGGRHRCNGHAQRIRALFVDCDGTMPLPYEWAMAPSMVILRDAKHWHAYWLVADDDATVLDRFTPAQAQMAAYYHTDPSVTDLARVMRVPGWMHCKADPVMVRLVECAASRRYRLDDILSAHPVDWRDVDDDYVLRGRNAGVSLACDEYARRYPAVPGRAYGRVDGADLAWDEQNFAKYVATMDTSEGAGNPRGGRDRTAYVIAAEGCGRGLAREFVVAQVCAYLERAGWDPGDIERNAEGKVSRAWGRRCVGHAPQRDERWHDRRTERGGGPARGRGTYDDDPIVVEDDDDQEAPAAVDAAPAAAGDVAYGGLDLQSLSLKWMILTDGAVVPVEWVQSAEAYKPRPNKRVSSLPIWPEQQGTDVAAGDTYWRLGWRTPRGQVRQQWVHERDLKDGFPLVELPEAPVTRRRAPDCAVWLTEARAAVTLPPTQVISRVGWCGVNGSRRWVWPGVGAEQGIEYIGGELEHHGTLDGWAAGLREILALPEDDGYVALACVCLSAAAPWSRLAGGRNPVIGLMCRSSSGKGSTLDYALSMWTNADALRLPASSTAKGIQDRGTQMADCPVFLDELQQLAEYSMQQASDALYFLANGQRRTTSSKSQQAVGGERRHGVGFYAAEAPVLPGLNLGVHYRVIELDGMPCPTEAVAKSLQHATAHYGQVAPLIGEMIQGKTPSEWIDVLRAIECRYRPDGDVASGDPAIFAGLRGDDAGALALIAHGAAVLQTILGVDIETDGLIRWLASQISRQRRRTMDRETIALEAVLASVLNQEWIREVDDGDGPHVRREIEYRTVMTLQQRPLAWRRWGDAGETLCLEIDPDHPALAGLFREHGGSQRVLKGWSDRGWIDRQGKGMRVKKRGALSGYVVRFTAAGLCALEGDTVA